MVKLAIRDDDLNFFTKVEDLEQVYGEMPDIPISYAAVPMIEDASSPYGDCPDTKGNTTPRWIGDNQELIEYLRKGLNEGKVDICMHGLTHACQGDLKTYKAEMEWRKEQDLKDKIRYYHDKMEAILNYKIKVFVAPNNNISKYGLRCVSELGMDYSGIVPLGFNREFTLKNINNYIYRWWLRFKDQLPYPNILKYSDHKEINACSLQGYDYLVKMYRYCERIKSPMVVNVHYWYLRDNPKVKEGFSRFINYAKEKGVKPASLSEILNGDKE